MSTQSTQSNSSIQVLKEFMIKYDEYLSKYKLVFFGGIFFVAKFRKVGRELLEIEKNLITKVDDESLRKGALELESFITSSLKSTFPLFFMGKHATFIRQFLINIPSIFPELAGLKDKAAKTTQYNSAYYVKALKKELIGLN
ncbi:hypothetical protein [Candidatus Lokiarchaeum ossiferum]|uniref:hypothetical protein n=1 Tax=Candidatus Lokiarchaeum ossiferum TaxID=2951803 RepID=UPI00352C9281